MGSVTKAMREYKLAHPYCEACGAPATDCHHIRTRRAPNSDRAENFLHLCHACHMEWHNRGRWRFIEKYQDKIGRKCANIFFEGVNDAER